MSQTNIQYARLGSADEALRSVLLMLSEDAAYRNAPLPVVRTVWRSLINDQYLLMIKDNEVCAALLWCEVSQDVRDRFLESGKEPALHEALPSGVAMFATAIVAREPKLINSLWRTFVSMNANREILYIRHYLRGETGAKIGMVRNGRLVGKPANAMESLH